MKNSKNVTRSEMAEMLKNWNFGAQPASVQYITNASLTKDGEAIFGRVIKIANVGGMIGYSYENSVNNQREREGLLKDFLAEKLWKGAGERVSTALARHIANGKLYLTFKKQQTFQSFYFTESGKPVSKNDLKPYFKPITPSAKQGVEKEVKHREISLDNTIRIKFRKTTYNLV